MGDALIRIMIVEDHPIVRLGLATVVDAQVDLGVVAEAERSEEALLAVARAEPSLVILPLRLGGEPEGLELCREIKSLDRVPHVLMYTSFTAPDDAGLAFLSGADSFITKDQPTASLLETIRSTATGRRVWSTKEDTVRDARSLSKRMNESLLTSREREVLGFMLQRYTNAEIARELFIGLPTVKTHVSNVLQKLGIDSRMELFGQRLTVRQNR
ncbi:response regulator [Spelaeicoccus albus]|uniref:NarL family two-component system response regulator LiaR n=1 Tax=Spelaeicoccus albus TaxID=1280376 RepID=A0A7Z0D4N2_9MICO|nr:response regulator transcription factor [Spelaeicoccus albus]NYI68807.1 NarL family two-component system response regulator LiaR [Spelaeicoccus albus]